MITNATEGYENDDGIINPVVGYERQSEHTERDKLGVGICVTSTTHPRLVVIVVS